VVEVSTMLGTYLILLITAISGFLNISESDHCQSQVFGFWGEGGGLMICPFWLFQRPQRTSSFVGVDFLRTAVTYWNQFFDFFENCGYEL
jgi:hypothetical protein